MAGFGTPQGFNTGSNFNNNTYIPFGQGYGNQNAGNSSFGTPFGTSTPGGFTVNTAPPQPTAQPFGQMQQQTPAPTFNSNPFQSNTASTPFGQSTFGAQASSPTAFGATMTPAPQPFPATFGSQAPASNNPFGSTGPGFGSSANSNPFGQQTSQNTSTFGSAPAFSSNFQQSAPAPSSSFRTNPFGASAPSTAFSSAFPSQPSTNFRNQPNQPAPSFAAPAPTMSFPSSTFGNNAPSAPFGGFNTSHSQQSTTSFATSSSTFGAPASSAFGTTSSSGFAQSTNPFGRVPSQDSDMGSKSPNEMASTPVFQSDNEDMIDDRGKTGPTLPTVHEQSEDLNAKLAELKAKMEEKKRKMEEKRRKAAATMAEKSSVTAPSGLNASAPSFVPKSDLAERNAQRFANTSSGARQFLPDDLRRKAESGDIDQPNIRVEAGSTRRDALSDAVTLVGTCPHMCPDEELLRREREGDIQMLELPRPGELHPEGWTFRNTVVKRFRRSAADYKLDVPEWVRPPDVLERVCGYLEEWVMERDRQGPDPRFPQNGTPPPLDVYQFIWDRTRMIRKDFILQNYVGTGGMCDARAVRCHERIARWHAMCEHQLSHINEFVVAQSQQNIQELGQTMKTLNQYYDDSLGRHIIEVPDDKGRETRRNLDGFSHGCSSDKVEGRSPEDFDGSSLDNSEGTNVEKRIIGGKATDTANRGTAEPEMRGLYILLTIDNDGGSEVLSYAAKLFRERPLIYHSFPVQRAIEVYKAKREYNYAKFFKLLRDENTPYLFACIMFKHVEIMRKSAFRIMSKTVGGKGKDKDGSTVIQNDAYPLEDLVHLLCFEDEDEALSACNHYSIAVDDRVVYWRRSSFKEPRDPEKGTIIPLRPRKMVRTIEGKLAGATRLAVCRGQVSGEGAVCSSEMLRNSDGPSSFTSSGEQMELIARMKERQEQRRLQAEKERQESAEREKALQMARKQEAEQKRIQEEKKRAEGERKLREEGEKAEAKRRDEEAARRLEEDRKRKKREEEEAQRQEEMRRAEEARRKAAYERQKAEEEARQQEFERQKQAALKAEREERKRKEKEAKLLELQRQRDEELRRREELERQAKEEEMRRKARELERAKIEWQNKCDEARKRVFLLRWKEQIPKRVEVLQNLRDSLKSFDRDSLYTNGLIPRIESVPDHSQTDLLRVNARSIFERSIRATPSPNDILETLKALAEKFSRFPIRDSTSPYDSVLLVKIAVFTPFTHDHSYEKLCQLSHLWADSRLGYGKIHEVEVPSMCLRVVFVNGNKESCISSIDASILVVPARNDNSLPNEDLQMTKENVGPSLQSVVMIGEFPDSESARSAASSLSTSFYDPKSTIYVTYNEHMEAESANNALSSAFEYSLLGNDRLQLRVIDRFTYDELCCDCISAAFLRTSDSSKLELMERAHGVLNLFEDEVEKSNNELSTILWPGIEFSDGSRVKDYFGTGIHLPVAWHGRLDKSLAHRSLSLLGDILDNPLSEALTLLLRTAPIERIDECRYYTDRQMYGYSLCIALKGRREWGSLFAERDHLYLPRGFAKVMVDRVVQKFESIHRKDESLPVSLTTFLDREYVASIIVPVDVPRPIESPVDFVEDRDEVARETSPALSPPPISSVKRAWSDTSSDSESNKRSKHVEEGESFLRRLESYARGGGVNMMVGRTTLSSIVRKTKY